jgi:hypothetical protein
MKKHLICLFGFFALTIAGCATATTRSFYSPIPEDKRAQIRSIAVVPASFTPTGHFFSYPKGRPPGTSNRAAEGAIFMAVMGGAEVAKGNPYSLLFLPFFLATGTIVGAVSGDIEGGLKGVPKEEAANIRANINQALRELEIQKALTERFISVGTRRTPYRFVSLNGLEASTPETKPEYKSFQGQGFDLILEVSVEKVGFNVENGQEPLISFFIISRIRAIQTSDGSEIFTDTFYYESPQRRLSEWTVSGAIKLKEAFEKGYGEIAEPAIEKIFLLHFFKVDSMWSGASHCMLKPISPELLGLGFFSHQLKAARVDTLQPTFKWESFPREKDGKADQVDILNRIRDITYEFRLWRGKNGAPDERIYTRQGIPASEHTVEIVLEPSTEYFWTVRAEFNLGGQRRVTKWSYSRLPWPPGLDPCLDNSIPLYHYYRFLTPSPRGNETSSEKAQSSGH